MHRLVNGKKIDLTPEEIAEVNRERQEFAQEQAQEAQKLVEDKGKKKALMARLSITNEDLNLLLNKEIVVDES